MQRLHLVFAQQLDKFISEFH
uniref:Uncharacterized protein n=1 Tax=Anguilla anguilla TaxID=7936 RepID=A0A0E9PA72_ANGAN